MTTLYIIGSLRNPKVLEVGNMLRAQGYEAFDDWYAAGPEADDKWQEYEHSRGRHYGDALYSYHARDVFEFDKRHLDRCDGGVLIMPAGKSGHLELGYLIGSGKPGFVLFDRVPDRFDVMYQFAQGVAFSDGELLGLLEKQFVKTKQVPTPRRQEADTKGSFPKELRSSKQDIFVAEPIFRSV